MLNKNGPGTFDLSSLVTLSTNRAQRTLTPGLWEGMVRSAWDTTTLNPNQAIMLTPRAAIGTIALNTTYAGGLWNGNNHTYIYTGYIWNRATTNAVWSFRGRFDDNVQLMLDGAILINAGNSAVVVTNAMMSPGSHAIELRFGDGSLFTCSLVDPQTSTDQLANVAITLADGTALDLNGGTYQIGLLTGTGAVSNGTLAAGSVISPAGDDAVGTMSMDGLAFAAGVVYRLTVLGHDCDCLTSTGTLDLSGVSIIASKTPDCAVSTYLIAHANGGITGAKPTVSGFPSKYKIIRKGTDLLLTSQGGTILTVE